MMLKKKKNTGQAREEIVALGNWGYSNAVKAIMEEIGNLVNSIEVWNGVLARLGDPIEGRGAGSPRGARSTWSW
jgi:hypothetical protein